VIAITSLASRFLYHTPNIDVHCFPWEGMMKEVSRFVWDVARLFGIKKPGRKEQFVFISSNSRF